MSNNNNTKFTATLVNETDKNIIVALRNETNLSEKELMTLVIAAALTMKDEILTQAAALIETQTVERAQRKVAAYEALKQQLQVMRAANKPAKQEKTSKTAAVAAQLGWGRWWRRGDSDISSPLWRTQ